MRQFVFQMLNMGSFIRAVRLGALFTVTLASSLLAPLAWSAGLTQSTINELEKQDIGPVITNQHTGIASGGFDPVAYFTKTKTVSGLNALQASFGHATFLFSSSANRDVFVKSPQLYMARFGGHCAMQMSKGLDVAGNPKIWAIYQNRLFFFHSDELRNQWLKQPATLLLQAEEKWQNYL